MPIEDKHFVLAPNPTVLLGFCAPPSVVSVASSWWVAAAGFVVVVLQRYRSCGSWACPGGLVSGWTWCWGRIWGCLVYWSLRLQGSVIVHGKKRRPSRTPTFFFFSDARRDRAHLTAFPTYNLHEYASACGWSTNAGPFPDSVR